MGMIREVGLFPAVSATDMVAAAAGRGRVGRLLAIVGFRSLLREQRWTRRWLWDRLGLGRSRVELDGRHCLRGPVYRVRRRFRRGVGAGGQSVRHGQTTKARPARTWSLWSRVGIGRRRVVFRVDLAHAKRPLVEHGARAEAAAGTR